MKLHVLVLVVSCVLVQLFCALTAILYRLPLSMDLITIQYSMLCMYVYSKAFIHVMHRISPATV